MRGWGAPDLSPPPTASAMARGVRAAEGGAREAGTRARPQGSPGQHARHWASKRRLLQPRSVTAPGRLYFSGFSASDGNHRRIRVGGVRNLKTRTQAPGSGLGAARGSTPKTGTQTSLPCIAWRREYERLGSPRFEPAPDSKRDGARGEGSGGRSAGGRHPGQASGQPGAACAPLGEQAPPLTAPICHGSGEAVFFGIFSIRRQPSTDQGRGRPESQNQDPGTRIRPRGSPGVNAEDRNSNLPPLHRLARRLASVPDLSLGKPVCVRFRGSVEGGAREAKAGTRARPQGSPGQHARHWASKSALCSSNLS